MRGCGYWTPCVSVDRVPNRFHLWRPGAEHPGRQRTFENFHKFLMKIAKNALCEDMYQPC